MANRSTRTTVIGQVYSWDLADGRARAEQLREAGVDDVAIAANYHAVRAVRWSADDHPIVIAQPRSAWHLPVEPGRWGRLVPPVAAEPDGSAFAASLDACASAGLGTRAWLVLTHDDDALAVRNPDLATVDAWGTRSTVGLCPSQPEVADYCRRLITETVRLTGITTFLLESLTPPGFRHSHAHDKAEHSSLTTLDELLLSLCFCAACAAELADDGVAIDELRSGDPALAAAAFRTRARIAARIADELAAPVDEQKLTVTITSTASLDRFGAFAPLDSRPAEVTGLCADLSAADGTGWSDLAAWSDGVTTVAGTVQVGPPGRTLRSILISSASPRTADLAAIDELYLYHLGMRPPATLSDLQIDSTFQGEK